MIKTWRFKDSKTALKSTKSPKQRTVGVGILWTTGVGGVHSWSTLSTQKEQYLSLRGSSSGPPTAHVLVIVLKGTSIMDISCLVTSHLGSDSPQHYWYHSLCVLISMALHMCQNLGKLILGFVLLIILNIKDDHFGNILKSCKMQTENLLNTKPNPTNTKFRFM